jgi:2-polyprenyl-6-methoxyphenol hydroxylase-like FAD-dependent oxidoreductase
MASSSVLVVGAGPVGLMMATELLRHGTDCRVVDRAPAPSPYCRAVAVQMRTLELFDWIGVVDQALDAGLVVRAANIYRDGVRVHRFEIDPTPKREVPFPFVLSLEQNETERILRQELERLGGRVEWGTELVGLTQDDEAATAILRGPTRGEQARVAFIVGCDGAHSFVRKALRVRFEGAAYPESFVLADVTVSGPLATDESYRFISAEQALVVWPIRGCGRFFLTGPEGEVTRGGASRVPPTLSEMQALVDALTPERVVLSRPRWLARYRVHRRVAERYRGGRVLLAGNAGHVHSTTGAQGMNTGLQDAYNLAWKLALVASGWARPALLDSYEVERRPVALKVLETSEQVFSRESPDPERARRRIVGMLSQLDVSYRCSPIVASHPLDGDASVGPDGGDRAPDGLLAPRGPGPRRLFELLRGTRHTLLVFAGDDSSADDQELCYAALRVAESYPRLVDVHRIARERGANGAAPIPAAIDPDGMLHAAYGAAKPAVYLIRPDGYVAFRSGVRGAPALMPFLASVFAR